MNFPVWKSIKIRKLLVLSLSILFVSLSPIAHAVFINEIHYDNNSGDIGEGVELAGAAGVDLTGWTLLLYNGSTGATYGTPAGLGGVIPDMQSGFGVLDFAIAGLQNGAPDGLALVDDNSMLIQFLSYEGSFLATSGVANGVTSTDIGVSEPGNTSEGLSLQLVGSGSTYEDFTWDSASPNSFGAINSGQNFVSPNTTQPTVNVPEPSSGILLGSVLLVWLASGLRNSFNRNRWRPGRDASIPA